MLSMWFALAGALAAQDSVEPSASTDVVIYGATSAGIVAAVQARREGLSVVVVGPDRHLGGLSASGLGWTDSGDKRVVGGIAREFYQRLKRHYDEPASWRWQESTEYSRYQPDADAMWVFEPHVAEAAFEALVSEHDIPVHRERWLDRAAGVVKDGSRVVSIRMKSGEQYHAKVFIDATYEGDLLAASGVDYRVGRESNEEYGETLNGVQVANAVSHQFQHRVSPFVDPDDPASGLLPHVHDGGVLKDGSGDHRVQAYTYRMCLTNHPDNRVPFPKPEGYDALDYELLLRDLVAGSRHIRGKFDPAPNRKTDTNNHGSFSSDAIGLSDEYPEAAYERRQEILAAHRRYQQGYYWFLCHDPRVPEDAQQWMNQWGLAADEFVESGHWPHQIYVREARRMRAAFVMTERHVRGLEPTPESIGMGSYNMDSHHVQRYVARDEDGQAYVLNEGDVQVSPGGAYPISYRAIVPRREQATNLLVPVCLSSSHIAYGSIRMEPVFMVLGQSAASAAYLAIENDVAVQDVEYDALRERLRADGQVLITADRRAAKPANVVKRESLEGVVVDDREANFIGRWVESESVGPYVGHGYRHDGNADKGAATVRFEVELPEAGRWEVRLGYTAHANRARAVPVQIHHGEEVSTRSIDQTLSPAWHGCFTTLGTYDCPDGYVVVEVRNEGTDGFVVVDALQCLRRE